MAVILITAYFQPEERLANNPHRIAETVGKTVTALALFAGIVFLYIESIAGLQGSKFLTSFSFKTSVAICCTLGFIDLVAILGLISEKTKSIKKTSEPVSTRNINPNYL